VNTTDPQPVCPNCTHPHHLPGTECQTPVHHGPNRWHLCLCLARPGAALSCPPQMTCQGGTLGYADIWYLQHGHVLVGEDGTIAPGAVQPGVASVGFPSGPDLVAAVPVSVPPAADQAAKAEALLLHFTAEAHRRKWSYDRGLDNDGVPLKSEAFDALHRLGDEMNTELHKLRRMADETPQPETPPCANCDKPVRLITGTLATWWVHDPGGHTICDPQQPNSPRAAPAAPAQPAKEA